MNACNCCGALVADEADFNARDGYCAECDSDCVMPDTAPVGAKTGALAVLDAVIARSGHVVAHDVVQVRADLVVLIEAAAGMRTAAAMLAVGTTHGMAGSNPEGARQHYADADRRLSAALDRMGGQP